MQRRDRDGVSICAWGVFLLTNWAQLLIAMPRDVEVLALDLLGGILASLMYAAWMKRYLHARLDAQGRQTLRYRRLRSSALILGLLFASTSLRL